MIQGNKLAITSGFDKMDEVKRWDLRVKAQIFEVK